MRNTNMDQIRPVDVLWIVLILTIVAVVRWVVARRNRRADLLEHPVSAPDGPGRSPRGVAGDAQALRDLQAQLDGR